MTCIYFYHKLEDDSDSERTSEVKKYMDTQMLHLARQSRDAYNAKIQYQRLRLQELEMMRCFTEDELAESEVSLRQVERRLGQIRKRLYANGGIPGIDQCRMQWSGLFRVDGSSCAGSACDQPNTGSSDEDSDLDCSQLLR